MNCFCPVPSGLRVTCCCHVSVRFLPPKIFAWPAQLANFFTLYRLAVKSNSTIDFAAGKKFIFPFHDTIDDVDNLWSDCKWYPFCHCLFSQKKMRSQSKNQRTKITQMPKNPWNSQRESLWEPLISFDSRNQFSKLWMPMSCCCFFSCLTFPKIAGRASSFRRNCSRRTPDPIDDQH